MVFGGGEWVRIVNSVLNIKATNHTQAVANTVPPRCHRWTVRYCEFNLPGRAAKGELMLFSFCFIGKQVRQVTVQFAFPCSL